MSQLQDNYDKEAQANEFAMALLMPETEYRKQVALHTNGRKVNTKAIADYFHVDIQTAYLRGVSLGILQW